MIDPAFAGHAGETGVGLPMPHDIMSGLALVAGLALLSLILLSLTAWKVRRIERRLQHLEEQLSQIGDKLPR
ncbi:MAG TPA: hypothetical protein VNK46_08755 [Nitrospiraceae bacterium]|jgi:hypothetical protein|nr:hypothetical protein [Nitrospiraceae bacterium]